MEIVTLGMFGFVVLIGLAMAIFRGDYSILGIVAAAALCNVVVFTAWHALHKLGFASQAPTLRDVTTIFMTLGVIASLLEPIMGVAGLFRLIFRRGEDIDDDE